MSYPAALTSEQLADRRAEGDASILYLAILKPVVVFAAQINQVFTTHDMQAEATFDTVTAGAYTDILPGMLMYVGSTPGASDKGFCRMRKAATSTKVFFGEVSAIAWANDLFITVVRDFPLAPRHVRIVSKVARMDYEVVYSDQHANRDPVPLSGGHAAVFLGADGHAIVPFSGSESYVAGGGATITAHSWTVTPSTGVTITGGTTATPSFDFTVATGNEAYLIAHQVTASNGKIFTGYRRVFVFDDEMPPVTQFTLVDCVGDFESGNWEFSAEMLDEASISLVRERSMCILFSRDYLDGTQVIPGVTRENILAVGWITGEPILHDVEAGTATFTARGPAWWMGKMPAYPAGVARSASVPTDWTEMQNLTTDLGLWHYLHWRTTATAVMDVRLTGDTKYATAVKAVAANFLAQLETMATRSILARVATDCLGRLFIKVDQNLLPAADRSSIPVVMDITKQDRQGEVSLQRVTVTPVSQIDLSGVAVNSSGSASSYFSFSPGHIPLQYGDPEKIDKLLLSSQLQGNSLAGLVLGKRNNELEPFDIRFAGNYRVFDIAPHQYATITLDAADNPRGVGYSGKIIPRQVRYVYDPDNLFLDVVVTFETETFEQISTNGDIPTVDGPITPPTYPPIPPPSSPPDPPVEIGTIPLTAIFVLSWDGLYVCRQPNITPKVWEPLNTYFSSITDGDLVAQALRTMRVGRFSRTVYVIGALDNNLYALQAGQFGAFVFVPPLMLWARGSELVEESSAAEFAAMDVNPYTGQIAVVTKLAIDSINGAPRYLWTAGSHGSSLELATSPLDATNYKGSIVDEASAVTIRGGVIIFGGNTALNSGQAEYSTDGGSTWEIVLRAIADGGGTNQNDSKQLHIRIDVSSKSFFFVTNPAATTSIYTLYDYTSNLLLIGTIADQIDTETIAVSIDGETLFAQASDGGALWRSVDGGATWTNIETTAVTYEAKKRFVHVSGFTWLAMSQRGVFVTFDNGDNWDDITGNLVSDFGYLAGSPKTLTIDAKDIDFIY